MIELTDKIDTLIEDEFVQILENELYCQSYSAKTQSTSRNLYAQMHNALFEEFQDFEWGMLD